MIQSKYKAQVDFLLDVLGDTLEDKNLVLKGGTAINLFLQDMPRLSVDIDIAYTKISERQEFLDDLNRIFQVLKTKFDKYSPFVLKTKEGIPRQIRLRRNQTEVKIEINLVLRGLVYPEQSLALCEKTQSDFEKFVKVRCASFEDLYAGKFCAALDRQHPRDLFDVMMFFQENNITEKLKTAFLVYLLSGNRPISEMIHPNRIDQRQAFENEFIGMTDIDVTYEQLEKAREQLIDSVDEALTQEDRQFLLSFKIGEPNWKYFIGLDHIKNMPSVKWKLSNIKKMTKDKHKEAVEELRRKLEK